jgi:sec-independent protein translocase protein TatA
VLTPPVSAGESHHFGQVALMIHLPPMVAGIGTPELVLILIVVLVIFGPKQLPKIGRALGGGIKEFKDGLKTGMDDEDEERERSQSHTTVTAHPPEALPPTSPPAGDQGASRPAEQPREQPRP